MKRRRAGKGEQGMSRRGHADDGAAATGQPRPRGHVSQDPRLGGRIATEQGQREMPQEWEEFDTRPWAWMQNWGPLSQDY